MNEHAAMGQKPGDAEACPNQALNAESYGKLARQSIGDAKVTYRLDDPLLFQAVATQHIPAAPGPSPDQQAQVSPRSP